MHDMDFLHQNYDGSLAANYPPVIIVEDDKLLGISIKKYLEQTLKLRVELFASSEECLMTFAKHHPKDQPFCLLTDISLEQGSDGLLLIDILKERGHEFVSIVMTGFASIETAIAATKKGAFHYLTKPFELENLKSLVIEALQTKLGVSLPREIVQAGEGIQFNVAPKLRPAPRHKLELPSPEDMFEGMVGKSRLMKEVFDRIKKVARTDSTVLIMGPSGTGKELVASAIHRLSERSGQHKISVNCGAIPADLLESELFGHLRGSFTGAISNRKGRFELAHGGSIFLDEIGDMPLLLQVKLLRVLQERQIEPVGSVENINIDVRVIAATHRDLEKAVSEGKFREDLFYRLNVIPIRMPALKDHREDIPLLIAHFLDRFVSADRSNGITFASLTMDLLMGYDWPGNVRELENVIERLVILRGGNEILPEDLPAKIFRSNPLATQQYKTLFELPEPGVDLKQILSDIEDSLIMQAMNRTRGNKNQASKLLTLNRTTLIEKMKKKNLEL
jgi:two-component system, NtrC family, response regulator PilR